MKKNGFNWPFHPAQILSWIFYAINLISYYLIILPCVSSISHIGMAILSILYLFLNGAVLFYALRVMSSNPTDREVLLNRELMKKGITPEKGDLKMYCEVCESYVNERTKHCGQCNRCVELFDHHCKWLNNCIGAKNYKAFIILIILVGAQTFYYSVSGIIYISLGYLSRPKDVESGLCLIERKDHEGLAIFMTTLVLVMVIISCILFIGICLLLKLHYKLTKYDFTTFEYIQYMDVRKDRLKRLKEGFITKERFKELDKQARDLKVKKRSKIIKEVNQENEEEIIQKILRRKRQMEIDEENKVTGMRNLTKKPKDKLVDTQVNVRDAGTESPNEEDNHIMDDLEEEKQLMRSKDYKKKNSFWCSSTFCIPCTRRVVRERNIVNKEDSKKDDFGNSFTKTIMNNESYQPNRAKSQKVLRTEESYKNDIENPPTITMKKTPVPNQDTSIEYITRGRGRPSNTPHLNHQNRRDEITHTPEILNSFERNLENSQSNRSAGSTIVENRVGFKHEEMSPYNYSLTYNKKGRLQPLTKQNNFVAKPIDNFMNRSFNRNTSRMDMVYKKSDESLKESRNSMEQDLPNPYGMSQIEEESPSFYTKNQG